MNLRQKRKHFKYSSLCFSTKAFVGDTLSTKKLMRKYCRIKLKINKTYDYDECCYNYYINKTYNGNKPKFMRIKRYASKKGVDGIDNEW